MRAGYRRIVATCAIVAVLPVFAAPAAAGHPDRARAADSLRRLAAGQVAVGTLDARRTALIELEQASQLAPDDHRVWLDLGRLCLERGERARGRGCYEHARRAAPDDAEAHEALARAWTWEWLASFDAAPLAEAERELVRATELAPGNAETWSELSALALARGQVELAFRAAERGRITDPDAWDPQVASACAAYRRGDLARADSTFRRVRMGVPAGLAERFETIVWAHGEDTEEPGAIHIADPDLTTPENEAELDYLTRLGLALLLFRDVHGVHWDMRTELFVRYGPPASVDVNPIWSPLFYRYSRYDPDRPLHPDFVDYRPPPMPYPFSMQAWNYPELGIRAALWDRTLTQDFQLPPVTEEEPLQRPHPALLATRPDLVSIDGGRGVFHAMPPGSRPIPARGQLARFPSDRGTVLLAHVITAGEPTDSLSGAWAVVAPDGHVLARGSSPLASSSCDPGAERVAEFSTLVPPGDYRVDLSVSGSGGRHGIVRLGASIPPPDTALSLSDLVMLCSLAGAEVSPGAVRIEPDMERRFSGSGALTVYFEIDRLTPGSDGRSRFAYTYALQPVAKEGKKRRAPAVFEASREESHDGTHRRQFVTIPMRSIKSGAYDLAIEVRDLVAGTRAAAELRFVRE